MRHMYWITGLAGAALIIAPFVLGLGNHPEYVTSSILLGAAVVIVSVLKGVLHDQVPWEYWIIGLLSLVIAVTPFLLGFSTIQTAFLVMTMLGIVLFLLCAYQIFYADVRSQ